MHDRIKKIRKASFNLRRGSERFTRFSIFPASALIISALADAELMLILVAGIATAVSLVGGMFYRWSYLQLRKGLIREVRQLDLLTLEDQNALLADFLG